jgi:hypothetical protein
MKNASWDCCVTRTPFNAKNAEAKTGVVAQDKNQAIVATLDTPVMTRTFVKNAETTVRSVAQKKFAILDLNVDAHLDQILAPSMNLLARHAEALDSLVAIMSAPMDFADTF